MRRGQVLFCEELGVLLSHLNSNKSKRIAKLVNRAFSLRNSVIPAGLSFNFCNQVEVAFHSAIVDDFKQSVVHLLQICLESVVHELIDFLSRD